MSLFFALCFVDINCVVLFIIIYVGKYTRPRIKYHLIGLSVLQITKRKLLEDFL